MLTSGVLSNQRLPEFLAFLAAEKDEACAVRVAVERAASALEAEVAVVREPGRVVGSVGFAVGKVPTAELAEVLAGRRGMLDVPGAGACHVAVAPLDCYPEGQLIVARSGADEFTVDEVGLLRGMARALELTLGTLRTLVAERRQAIENTRLVATLQQRQRLLEQISDIQRAITRRAPLQQILDAITIGAQKLLGDEVVGLRMRDPDDPNMLLLVSCRGLDPEQRRRVWRVPLAEAGPPGQAMQRDDLVVVQPPAPPADSAPLGAATPTGAPLVAGIVAGMAAPVHENGAVVGSLEVASLVTGPPDDVRVYTDADQEILRVFAEHVSLAVTDANTQEAMRQAFHDPLTGLASRRLFMDRLDHALAGADRSRTRVAVLFVDLDRFKIVNDSLGHAAGDSLLVGVADRLRSCLRDGDMQALAGSYSDELHGMAARLGGDEFAVVLAGLADEAPAVRVAERILESLRAPFLIDGKEAFVEASIGIALDTDERCGQTLLRNADLAMYQAKRNGEGRYEIFEPALRIAFLRRLDLEADLRHAVSRAEFLLHFQPIFALESDLLVGVEALLRWQHPQRGLIAPREFIPLAEETGLILPIDIWALTQACAQASAWNRQRRPQSPLTLSVNLSVRQLQRADLPDIVARTLLNTGFAPEQLVLEITESLLLHRTDVIIERLRELKQLRVRLAVDDFGTGYSSLAYLRHLPVDILKIDKSFVDEITSRPEASGLARAIVQLGRTLGLVTVAEGIEALDQRNELREAGCDLGQGFYFAKPLTAAEIEPLLLDQTGFSAAQPRPASRPGGA